MEWRDVAETVGAVAPVAGSLLAGAAGHRVGSLLATALGVEARPDAVAAAMRADPDAALKLRKIEADLETSLIEGRTQVVVAEAQGESWLQRNWRPLTMLSFTMLVGAHWLGFTAENLTQESIDAMMRLVQIGMGGYVIGRSAEKITKSVTGTGIFEHLAGKAKR